MAGGSIVKMISGQLAEMGFRQLRAKNLKAKHANALVERWKQEGLSLGTLKNRMGVLRWMYDKAGKGHLMYRKNEDYGIGNRQYATNENKARELTPESLALIKSEARPPERPVAAGLRAQARRGDED